MKIRDVRLKKHGNSFVFRIPYEYIRNRNLDPEKEYDLEIEVSIESDE